MENISFSGKIEFEEYKKYNIYHSRKSYVVKFFILFISYLAMIFGLGVGYEIQSEARRILYMTSISFVLSIMTILFLVLNLFRRVKKVFISSNRVNLEQYYTVVEEGIKCKNDRGETIVSWEDIVKVCKYKEIIIVYTSIAQALVIPKRFFNSEDEFEVFQRIFKEKLPIGKVNLG